MWPWLGWVRIGWVGAMVRMGARPVRHSPSPDGCVSGGSGPWSRWVCVGWVGAYPMVSIQLAKAGDCVYITGGHTIITQVLGFP